MTTTDNRTKRTTAANILSSIGLLAIMVAAALPLLKMGGEANKYIYSAGALLLLIGNSICLWSKSRCACAD